MSITERNHTEWMIDAQCREIAWDQFDLPPSVRGDSPEQAKKRRWAYARELCRGCPVVEACARDALDQRDVEIIRAGVPLPQDGSRSYRRAREALELIAHGVPIPDAAAHALAPPAQTSSGAR